MASIETLMELYEVLLRPKFDKYLSKEKRLSFFERYSNTALHIDVVHTVSDCQDPKDDKFLNLALSASADFIITGDSDLLVLNPYHQTKIVNPSDFIAF